MNNINKLGLKEQIKHATTEAEVFNLLASGTNYHYATQKTRSKWQKEAKIRIAALRSVV